MAISAWRSGRNRPDLDADLLRGWCPLARLLDPSTAEVHLDLAVQLGHHFRVEGSRGFEITDAMRAAIAGHAALLLLGLDHGIDPFLGVNPIIVHPSTIVQRGPRPGPVPGSVTEQPVWLAGQAHHRGPVLLSWSAVRRESLRPDLGEHVVLHELAHRLDLLDGDGDGTPPLAGDDLRRRWSEICDAELAHLRAGGPSVLRPYAATNAVEFFAVATEAFFCAPVPLRIHHPALYGVLGEFYGQDTAARWPMAAVDG